MNSKKRLASYSASLESGPALEIIRRQDITEIYDKGYIGLAHLASHTDKGEQMDRVIERPRVDGYTIIDEIRVSGDGYYGGVIRGPSGSIVEIIANGEPEIQVALFPPYELLLETDPDRERVRAYLKDSGCFIATIRNSITGVVMVHEEEGHKTEVVNLAVADILHRRGIARKLLRYISNRWAPAQDVRLSYICTEASVTDPMMLCRQEGFDLVTVDRDYSTRNYIEPIWENGIQYRH